MRPLLYALVVCKQADDFRLGGFQDGADLGLGHIGQQDPLFRQIIGDGDGTDGAAIIGDGGFGMSVGNSNAKPIGDQ